MLEARENANDQVAVGLRFASDLVSEFSRPIAKQSKIDTIPNYFRHSIKIALFSGVHSPVILNKTVKIQSL